MDTALLLMVVLATTVNGMLIQLPASAAAAVEKPASARNALLNRDYRYRTQHCVCRPKLRVSASAVKWKMELHRGGDGGTPQILRVGMKTNAAGLPRGWKRNAEMNMHLTVRLLVSFLSVTK